VALRATGALGLAEPVGRIAARISGFRLCRPHRTLLLSQTYGPDAPQLGVHRADLVAVLVAALSAGVVHTGHHRLSVKKSQIHPDTPRATSRGRRPATMRIYLTLEMRTVAGPSSVMQWVLSSGPCTVASHVGQVHVVCPPPWPKHA